MKTESITASGQMTFLRRRYPLRLRLAKGIVGAVPLADIVLLVILFLIMGSWIVLKPGVFLQLPEADFVAGVHAGANVVTLSREGLVFFNDERTTLDQLRQQLVRAVHGQAEPVLVIEADRRITHEQLIRVYDMAKAAGYDEVLLATRVAASPGASP